MIYCFRCFKMKPADEFQDNRRHYQIKSRQGKVFSCNSCAHKWVMDNLMAVRFDFENNSWIVHRFENKADAFNFLEAEIYQRAFKKIEDEYNTRLRLEQNGGPNRSSCND